MPKNLTVNHFETSGIFVEGQRSNFRFNKPVQMTMMSGMLNPVGDPIPVFPGVKFDLNMDAVIRSNTMVVPPLDGMYVDFFTVWVPHRIVWSHFPQFLGEPETTAWTQTASYVYPFETFYNLNKTWSDLQGSYADQSVSVGNLCLIDHYGLLAGIRAGGFPASSPASSEHINVLAFRGYYSLWNYLFRDENYQRPVLFSKGDTGSAGEFGYLLRNYKVNTSSNIGSVLNTTVGTGLTIDKAVLMPVNKLHDAFTSVLPQPQFGNAVPLELGDSAPVMALATGGISYGTNYEVVFANAASSGQTTQPVNVRIGSNASAGTLQVDLSNAVGANVNTLRQNVMTQRYLEALARGGRRQNELMYSIYGVKNTDAKCDYPQLQTRARYQLGVNQVVATADGSGSGWTSHLGDTGAYSLTVLRKIPVCEKDFSEFGYLHVVCCIRADNRYSQMIQPHFLKSDTLSEYNPYFDHIGDVDVKNVIVNTSAGTAGNWGYSEAWFDERTQFAMATGALNKNYGSLKYWVLGEIYDSSVVTCTPGWLTFDPAVLDDVFVSAYYAYPQFTVDARIYGKKVARMSQHSIPGIVGRI